MNSLSHRLQELVIYFQGKLNDIPPDQFSAKPHVGQWSQKEILGHLCDSASHNYIRFVSIALSEEPVRLMDYDQDRWVELNDYQNSYDQQDIILLWMTRNLQIATLLNQIPAEDYEKTCITRSGQEMTLQWLAMDYIAHTIHHFRQMLGSEHLQEILPE
ncbi:DinB family protein [Paenibacillus bovis]|uniref:DinB-like domain-containing protein n=1 Tax=Paenibacillus bovis TaxID=1616788 RepID=A0A172ZFG8_9BACL|nr:DinB family protein [Paenibacillus bovis]ANF96122.1 hypothetical protein AR543_09005 [Paenibacillus bovis]